MNITILGAGAFGKALGKVLTDNGHGVVYYDPVVFPDFTLDYATMHADVIIIAIPSNFIADLIKDYPAELKQIPTILATKGLKDASLFHDFEKFSVISGPAFAEEIMNGKSTTMTASDPLVLDIFQNGQIVIELCEDVEGILLCGSLKNIYAIGAGYHSDSHNEAAAIITRAHAETIRFLKDHGANPETADMACGLGDLILTCTSSSSRNFSCGQRLRGGEELDAILEDLKTVEGVNAIHELGSEDIVRYPLIKKITKIIE